MICCCNVLGGRDRACRELSKATLDLQRVLAEFDLHFHVDKTRVLVSDPKATPW